MRGPLQLYDAQGRVLSSTQAWPGGRRGTDLFSGLRDVAGLATEADNTDLQTLRQRSSALLRGSGAAQALVQTMLTGVVGEGLSCLPEVDPTRTGLSPAEAEDLEDEIRSEWEVYSLGLNYATPYQPFAELLMDLLRESLEFGDVFVVKISEPGRADYEGRVQVVESVRVHNRDLATSTAARNNGVSFDAYGRPVSYSVSSTDPQWAAAGGVWTEVTAEHMIHAKLPRQRVGATRGVPWLSHAIGTIHGISEYSRNEVVASWLQSLFALVYKSNTPADLDETLSLESGSIFRLGQEETMTSLDPSKPSRTFSDFFVMQLKVLSASVGLPYEVVLKSFTSSYSASRAAILQAEALFRIYRNWLVGEVVTPLYRRFLDEAVTRGRVRVPAGVLRPDDPTTLSTGVLYWSASGSPRLGSPRDGPPED